VLAHPTFAGAQSLNDRNASDIVAAISEHGASAGISMFSSTQYLNDIASYIDAARGSSSADIVAPVLADYELPRALPRPRATPTAAPPQAPQQVAAHAAQQPPPPPQT
jgi:hypothetical protein